MSAFETWKGISRCNRRVTASLCPCGSRRRPTCLERRPSCCRQRVNGRVAPECLDQSERPRKPGAVGLGQMPVSRGFDCLVVGYNEPPFSDYERLIRTFGEDSEAYRDLH